MSPDDTSDIIAWVRSTYQLVVGPRTAQYLRDQFMIPRDGEQGDCEIKGRDVNTDEPRTERVDWAVLRTLLKEKQIVSF